MSFGRMFLTEAGTKVDLDMLSSFLLEGGVPMDGWGPDALMQLGKELEAGESTLGLVRSSGWCRPGFLPREYEVWPDHRCVWAGAVGWATRLQGHLGRAKRVVSVAKPMACYLNMALPWIRYLQSRMSEASDDSKGPSEA